MMSADRTTHEIAGALLLSCQVGGFKAVAGRNRPRNQAMELLHACRGPRNSFEILIHMPWMNSVEDIVLALRVDVSGCKVHEVSATTRPSTCCCPQCRPEPRLSDIG